MRSLELADRLAAIVATQQEIASTRLDLRRVMDLVVQRAQELTRAGGAIVEILEGDELVFRAASGLGKPHLGHRLRVESSLSGRAVLSGDVLRSHNAQIDPYVDRQAARKIGVESLIVAPLKHEEKVLGALCVLGQHPNAFTDLDVYTLQLMAGFVAGSMRHAAEYEAKHQSEERYRLLFDRNVAGAFRTTLDGRVLDCNDSLARILGYASKEELATRKSWDLYAKPADREDYLAELKKHNALTNSRLRLKRKDGSLIEATINANLVPGPEGEAYVMGTLVEARASRAKPRRGAAAHRHA
jgi:PAS domain S-box-containing protein